MKFLHTADWQLGMTRHFLGADAQARYSAARRDAVAALGALARQTGAEFVVVAGDVFDANQLESEVISKSLEAMKSIDVPVYLLPGNHDPLDPLSVYLSEQFLKACPATVKVLDGHGPFDTPQPGVKIVAAPWRSKRPTRDLTAEVLADLENDGTLRILVAHGAIDILDPDRDNAAQIRMAGIDAALERSAVHYVALGDRHSRTDVGSSGRVWYSGTPEVTNYDHRELDSGHVLLVDIDPDNPTQPPIVTKHTVGTWRFRTVEHELNSLRDIATLDAELADIPNKDRTVVQLALKGTLTITERAELDACIEKNLLLFAALDTWDRHTELAVMPADDEFDDLDIGGFAADALRELVKIARGGGDDAEDARGALGLLVRLMKGTVA